MLEQQCNGLADGEFGTNSVGLGGHRVSRCGATTAAEVMGTDDPQRLVALVGHNQVSDAFPTHDVPNAFQRCVGGNGFHLFGHKVFHGQVNDAALVKRSAEHSAKEISFSIEDTPMDLSKLLNYQMFLLRMLLRFPVAWLHEAHHEDHREEQPQ